MGDWYTKVKAELILNFVEDNRWKYLVTGLGNTLKITLAAVLLGIVIGASEQNYIPAPAGQTFDLSCNIGKKEVGNVGDYYSYAFLQLFAKADSRLVRMIAQFVDGIENSFRRIRMNYTVRSSVFPERGVHNP